MNLTVAFREEYGRECELLVQAPGRVNLIGEHTDYNDGFVFPAAIDRHISVSAATRDDSRVRARSVDFNQTSEFVLADIEPDSAAPWSNYLRGVAAEYLKKGFELPGLDLVISGDVPIGAGLSSSAALEVASAETFRVLGGLEIDPVEMALLCQAAERRFVGVQCGIMDQFISVLARPNTALFLDCRELSYCLIPLSGEFKVVVCDTQVKRSLSHSEYNQRRSECEEAVRLLGKVLGRIEALRDVEMWQLEEHRALLPEVPYRRARHVVSENGRVLLAVEALKKGDSSTFGRLLYESHASLKDDYEVSCRELDLLVELAAERAGTVGARMTGAGFGGCTVNLVESAETEAFCEKVKDEYRKRTGIEAAVYVCQPSQGVSSRRT